MSEKLRYGIHWFRRDLRIAGNPALQWSWRAHEGRVLGIFCFDAKFLARPDFSSCRFLFFLNTLAQLRKDLRNAGGDLLFLDVGPQEAFGGMWEKLKKLNRLPESVSWNRDYEPFAVERDARMETWFKEKSVRVHSERDHLLIEPHEVGREGGKDPYQVFTPFSRKWLERFTSDEVSQRVKVQQTGLKYLATKKSAKLFKMTWQELLPKEAANDDLLERYRVKTAAGVDIEMPPAGSEAAYERLLAFEPALSSYGKRRDLPAEKGTSRFSIYFKNGSLTVAQVVAHYKLKAYEKSPLSGRDKFFSELIWREFYYHILSHFPYVEKMAFQRRYAEIKWQNREDWFEAWKQGQTGFPIVDAGMRELKQTGWMHNRVRMIVASFLTKDLLIDWRWGERHFMEKLLDGDLAPNNGGWQWAASTGCDPQPYFRIFNPLLQSKKFDPEGHYLRRYVPELASLDDKQIHDPPALQRGSYPAPLVDHAVQREKALKLYGA